MRVRIAKTSQGDEFMQELIDCLERCAGQSVFVSDQLGRIGLNDYRHLALRRWNDSSWMLWGEARLEIDDAMVSDLSARLEPFLREYVHAGSGRIGNGLFSLIGRPTKLTRPTLTEFARTLISAAARSSAGEVVATVLGWVNGDPLRFRISALLEGASIDHELQLAEGVHVSRLRQPSSMPSLQMAATMTEILTGVVMSIDCEKSPALYRPEEDESGRFRPCSEKIIMASERIPDLSLDGFCESVSLASNGCVDWFVQWKDLGELEAFIYTPPSVRFKRRSGGRGTKISQAALEEAVGIHRLRHAGGGSREHLELALRRWIGSKRPGAVQDKLIELRIALEALYGIGSANEKAFRIATYGAWHLGKDFQQRCMVRETLRKVYSDSSSAVHGGKLKHAAKKPSLVVAAQDICREGILKRLREAEPPKWDEMILGAGD